MRTVKLVLLAAVVATSGCDVLFKLEHVADAGFNDSPEYFQYDAVGLDTAGWPTYGNVDPLPCASGSLANEDGDQKTDECDNCPLDVNDDQLDGDRDGIGDICDPHPEYAVERLAYFEGFNGTTATDVGTPITSNGGWRLEGGALHQYGMGMVRTLFHLKGGPWREPFLHLRYSDVEANGTATTWWVGAYLVGETVTSLEPDGVQCRIRYGSGGLLEMVRISDFEPTGSSGAPITPSTADVTIAFVAQQLGTPPQCSGAREIHTPTDLPTQLLLAADPTDAMPGTFGLWTLSARVWFRGFAVYETIYP